MSELILYGSFLIVDNEGGEAFLLCQVSEIFSTITSTATKYSC